MKFLYTSILLFLLSAAGSAQNRYLYAVLEGAQEVPANASAAAGVVIIKYNSGSRLLELWGNYDGLSKVATASHVHSPAAAGSNASVLFAVTNTGGTTGTLTLNVTLSLAQESDLLAGNMYVNVHNSDFPGGEVRGQILESTNGQTIFFSGRLQGAQEVPPNPTTATGYVRTLLDKSLNKVYTTGSFTGLTGAVTGAHLHKAAPTVSGPVFTALSVTAAPGGTIHTVATVTAADATEMLNGNSYANLHTSTYPGGEIRGQLLQEYNQRFAQATLQASQEVPANSSTASGTVIVKYNTDTRLLELEGVFTNLSSSITGSHVHSPAAPGSNAGVIFSINVTGTIDGTLTLSATLTPTQESEFLNGLMYVNIHSSSFPGGEIRGQLLTTSAGNTFYLRGNVQGTQEVPSNASTATGSAQLLLDNITKQVWLSSNFTGLSAPATAAHIHQAAPGTNGGVIVTLTATPNITGTINGTATATAAFAEQVINGNSYLNIHNSVFPGGEVRAQFGNLVLPVKLLYFNGYKKDDKVVVQWATTNEINLSHFELQQFEKSTARWIGKTNTSARGNFSNSLYQETDLPTGDKNPFVLYRLKMVDTDGKFTYSPVIKINFTQSAMFLNLENTTAVSGSIYFTVSGSSDNKNMPASIIDNAGRTVLKTTASTRQKNQVDVSRLAAGVYQLIIRTNDGILKANFINF